MNFRDAWRETLAIYLLLLSDPGRVIRFAGAPALVLAVLGIAQMARSSGDGGNLLLLLSLLGTIWGLGVWTVRWVRFLLLGEDQVQFWDMPFSRRMWRTGGLLVAMVLLTCFAAILPSSLLLTMIGTVLGHGAIEPGTQTDAATLALALPDWFHVTAVLLPLIFMIWVVARLAPAIGSVVQDGPLVLRASWKATGTLGGLPPAMALLLVNLPLQLPGAALLLAGWSDDNWLLLFLGNLLLTVTHPLVSATCALLWARIYGVAIGPYLPRRPVRDEE